MTVKLRRSLHHSVWSQKNRWISLDMLSDEDPQHPRVGLSGSLSDERLVSESPEASMVVRLVEQLPERDRELLYLLFWDGRSQRDVAKQLGVTQPAVFYRCKRIMTQLRKELDGG